MSNSNRDLLADILRSAIVKDVQETIGSDPPCDRRAKLEQLVNGEWKNIGRDPTPDDIERMNNGEPVDPSDLPEKIFGCKHEAAEAFCEVYGVIAANILLGNGGPPLSDFRITELPQGE